MNPEFKMSPATIALRDFLASMAIGDFVSYRQLSDIIGSSVVGATPSLQSARRSLLNARSMVFEVRRGEGVTRSRDIEIVDGSGRDVKSIRRKARKGVRKLRSVSNYGDMPKQYQNTHSARVAVLSTLSEMAKRSTVAVAENSPETYRQRISDIVNKTASAFMEKVS